MACRPPLLLLCALLTGLAGAAELGEPRVSSHIGQQLVADIELTMLENPAAKVEVRLARPDVYRGANIGMPHVLSTLNLSVMQRDGRQFLHVTSLAPVESAHLHLYLELVDGGQRSVRLATLWLTPDPRPAPPPLAVAAPAPAPAVAPRPEPVAAPVAPVKRIERPAPKPARPAPVAAKPAPAPAPAPVACAPSPQLAPDKVCLALDAKNAQLREQIGTLEGKVKVLQVAMGASPAVVAGPKPAPAKAAKPRKKRPPEPEDETPWGLIGAAVGALALLGGAGVMFARRGKKQARAEPKVGLLARLRQRFAGKREPAAAVEPRLEDEAHESSTQA